MATMICLECDRRDEARGHVRARPPARLDSADVTNADHRAPGRAAGAAEPERRQLPPQYLPGEVESRLYQGWLDAGYFTADARSDAPAFTIMIPPPNVTGSLHIGHALDHTLIDTLVRRRRMQ